MTPHPQPQISLERISGCDQVLNGNSYGGRPRRGTNCSHCSFQDLHSFLSRQNCQSPISSVQRTQSTLADHCAIPRGTSANERQSRDSNRSTTSKVCEDQSLCFGRRYDRQRTLLIRIAITLTSDSAITIVQFRPSNIILFGSSDQT